MWDKNDYELFGINVLAAYNRKYQGLTKGESPDYFNNVIGVEITRAIATQAGEMDAFWKSKQNQRFSSFSAKQLKKLGFEDVPSIIGSTGVLYSQKSVDNGSLFYLKQKDSEELVLCGYIGTVRNNQSSSSDIKSSVSEKLNKLNDHYAIKEENDLLILIQEQLDYCCCKDEIVTCLIDEIVSDIKIAYSEAYAIYFNTIFIMFMDTLVAVDTDSWTYKITTVSQEQYLLFENK